MISVLNYGGGNLHSICHVLSYLSLPYQLVSTPEQVEKSLCLVVPGQGAFVEVMQYLRTHELEDVIRDHILKEKPFLGVCLGFQILFTSSDEHGGCKGLNVFPGHFCRFPDDQLSVPHMGWNVLQLSDIAMTLLAPYQHRSYVYFVHSYFLPDTDTSLIAAKSDYGVDFVSAIKTERLLATQFHPENSGEVGLALLSNFFAQVF